MSGAFSDEIVALARSVLAGCLPRGLRLATAGSCTGGLVAAALTELAGSSAVFDRGFVTYSDRAKVDELGVPADILETHGAVSEPVAIAMAEGALRQSGADASVSVTGYVGPDGGSEDAPVGTVHFAVATRNGATLHERHDFGAIGRARASGPPRSSPP